MKTIIVHIGTSKTGTTTIQNYLDAQHERLARVAGLELLDFGLERQTAFGESFVAHFDLLRWIESNHQAKLAAFRRRLQDSPSKLIIISCESFFFDMDGERIERLKALLAPHSVRVLCYLRRQDLLLESAWKQQTKAGFFDRTAAEHYRIVLRNARNPNTANVDYHRKLDLWRQAFGTDAIIARLFERQHFKDGDLLADFFDAIDVPSAFDPGLAPKRKLNTSLPSELCEVLAYINKLGLIQGSARYRSEFISWLQEIQPFQDPPVFGYAQRMELLAEYERSNSALFKEFFPGIQPSNFDRDDLPNRQQEQPLQVDTIAVLAGVLVQSWKRIENPKSYNLNERLQQLRRL